MIEALKVLLHFLLAAKIWGKYLKYLEILNIAPEATRYVGQMLYHPGQRDII